MTGRTTARRIEDLDTPALTYAEVKAIASGNPLVIEKPKVDAEVMRLSRLRSEHSESQFGNRARLCRRRKIAGCVQRHRKKTLGAECAPNLELRAIRMHYIEVHEVMGLASQPIEWEYGFLRGPRALHLNFTPA